MPQEREQLIADIAAAVRATAPVLSDDELRWVRLAIQREAQSIVLRRAIIEKTLAGLVWSAIIGLGVVLMDFVKARGWR